MRITLGRRAAAVSLMCLLSSATLSSAADLHFIALAETLDPDIGSDVDLQKAAAWAQLIASHTGLTLQYHSLSGENLTRSGVSDLVHSISPGHDDVVYFTYSGHGANLGESRWPSFTFVTGDVVDFMEVVDVLQPMPQRLLIVLADCCNVSFPSGRFTPLPDPAAQDAQTIANFQRLFLEFRGTIAASASSQGQYSLGVFGEGGLFLNTFMEDFLEMAASKTEPTWEDILEAVTIHTQQLAAQFDEIQRPQFIVNTEQVAADTPTPPGDDDSSGEDDSGDDGNPGSVGAPACGPMMTLPLAAGACAWIVRRKARR